MTRVDTPSDLVRAGRYHIVDRIAVGGMAEIFRATEPRAVGEPRTVVVKRMLPHVAATPGAAEMFADEARLASHVSHPNVVRMLDAGIEDSQPYLVLEYVRGCDLFRLSRHLTRLGSVLSIELALFVATEVLAGLAAVHAASDSEGVQLGIVHFDVSPSNVLVSLSGDVKIADFGIARASLEPPTSVGTRAKGKIGYLAPELVAGSRNADHRADVFSAAVITAELLMGEPLFAGGTELATLLAIRDGRIERFRRIAPSLPGYVADALFAALSTDPESRVADASTLRVTLLRALPEDLAPQRRELAGIVASVVGEGSGILDTSSSEVTSELPATPVAPDTETEGHAYVVTTPTGRPVGAFTFAAIIEAIATARVGPNDRVTRGADPAVPVYEKPELARHVPPSSFTPLTKESPAAPAAVHRVDIANAGFVRALARTTLERDTGLWLCEQGGTRKEVYIEQGVPAFVTSNLAGELLGESLVARGIVSRGELDMALAVMPRHEGKLGDTLVALGLVEPVRLFQHIATQVTEKLLDVFTWSSGTAAFYRGVPPPASGFPLAIDPWRILDEGIRRRIAQGLDDDLFAAHLGDSLERVVPAPFPIARSALPDVVLEALALLGSPVGLQDLVDRLADPSGRDPGRGYRAIALLLRLDVVRWLA